MCSMTTVIVLGYQGLKCGHEAAGINETETITKKQSVYIDHVNDKSMMNPSVYLLKSKPYKRNGQPSI